MLHEVTGDILLTHAHVRRMGLRRKTTQGHLVDHLLA